MIVTFIIYEEQSNIIKLVMSAYNYAKIMPEKYVKEKLNYLSQKNILLL